MARIELPKETRETLARALTKYLKDELDFEVQGFDAQFLLDFILETAGPHIYNQGLFDAQALVKRRLDEIAEAVYELEKPIKR